MTQRDEIGKNRSSFDALQHSSRRRIAHLHTVQLHCRHQRPARRRVQTQMIQSQTTCDPKVPASPWMTLTHSNSSWPNKSTDLTINIGLLLKICQSSPPPPLTRFHFLEIVFGRSETLLVTGRAMRCWRKWSQRHSASAD